MPTERSLTRRTTTERSLTRHAPTRRSVRQDEGVDDEGGVGADDDRVEVDTCEVVAELDDQLPQGDDSRGERIDGSGRGPAEAGEQRRDLEPADHLQRGLPVERGKGDRPVSDELH